MRVFYSSDFRGYWPVGTAAVIVARNADEAHTLLLSKLIGMGLGADQNFTLAELKTDSTNVVVLNDGDY